MRTDERDRDKTPAKVANNPLPAGRTILEKLLGRIPNLQRTSPMTLPPEDGNHSLNFRLKKEPPQPPRVADHEDHSYDGDPMIEAFHSDPFPRTVPATVFIDTEGRLLTTASHDFTHYVPDSIGKEKHDQFDAGPEAQEKPGLYELALCLMVHYLPAGFDGDTQRVMLRTPRPKSEPMGVSRPAWDLHVEFADDVLTRIRPEHTELQPGAVYAWISKRRPDLDPFIFAEPTPDPFEGLF